MSNLVLSRLIDNRLSTTPDKRQFNIRLSFSTLLDNRLQTTARAPRYNLKQQVAILIDNRVRKAETHGMIMTIRQI